MPEVRMILKRYQDLLLPPQLPHTCHKVMNEINQLFLPVFALGGKLIFLGCATVGFLATLFLSGYDPKDGDDD